ncbi:hypothetical protein HK405_012257, partial [Cladochytrium tenue]
IHGWDDDGSGDGEGGGELESAREGGYPWAHMYGGFQFGAWAGQLGDGRAISLFETTNAAGVRYELQLKGAGTTPYSRFADGKAVLRASIREFLVSEALHALGVPTARALGLVLARGQFAARDELEPAAVVCRFAQSWLRVGSFDILRARRDRRLMRLLATYLAEEVLGGWEGLPARLHDSLDAAGSPEPERGVAREAVQGPDEAAENRFARVYREVVRRNARTVAYWQAYGFMNGVLNTDNTSLAGLSMDFGPFGFMDDFDPAYTPNHDDYLRRYSYENQPSIIWWNLARLGEALAELLGAGSTVDDPEFVEHGASPTDAEPVARRAVLLIAQAEKEYDAVFRATYLNLMRARLGIGQDAAVSSANAGGDAALVESLLDTMHALQLDFHRFFRRLGDARLADLADPGARAVFAAGFLPGAGSTAVDDARVTRLAAWLDDWRVRVAADSDGDADAARRERMRLVNPNFVLRGWVLDEIVQRVQTGGERNVLQRVLAMALHPFEDEWAGGNSDE